MGYRGTQRWGDPKMGGPTSGNGGTPSGGVGTQRCRDPNLGYGVLTVGSGDLKMGVQWWGPIPGPRSPPTPPLTDVGRLLGHHVLLVADAGVGDAGLRRRGRDHEEPLRRGQTGVGYPGPLWGTRGRYRVPSAVIWVPGAVMGYPVPLWGARCCDMGTQCSYGVPNALMGYPVPLWGIQCCYMGTQCRYGVPGAVIWVPSAVMGNPGPLWGTW